ncbi:ABC transporter ATP-binding protein [Caldifermentibacillus hisashii]|jgi:ABC-2 type transport system ATP-binding protein|uniref:ABC transporter ATP-binding protein n=2 Tax=Bacillaceae TaxID=186817 RepID=A0ABU9JUY9_9BACI|nr:MULTISPECIES: ABC transporter ATP-binding protein [Bacillaceae]AWI11365.1 sodium ABC transporter ATP-binding protein [Caldibacillus thermoamylovorans]MBU5341509.1 ABC transporter ATP-binding protein [Caldifermentibacillus hisashii]MCM3055801.1 ABC transporter ATP-binding protein [Caldibacillus thermoamylovorans]MCM3799920.1 ABC transporter ATP-binding protein [Caldibacillus thermoamylovorans]MEC5273937.1 ABC transporter ATP-binding protein [Caldifermentibacillus hisashii]
MALEIEHVSKRFGKYTAVDDLSLSIPEKTIFGFLGANGAGKTTTFRIILGLMDASSGNVSWNGKPVDYSTSDNIGYLPEERGLYPKQKVKEQLIFLARLKGMSKQEAEKELGRWLERFKVPDYADKKVEELSKGNQQKIQFIASVLHKPSLLILDEPFSGLDPINVELLKQAVLDLKESGTTIVFSSHRMEHVEQLCENLCILNKGKTVLQGSLKEIKQSFGKKNLIIHADFDVSFLKEYPGVRKSAVTPEGIQLQIEGEEVAGSILQEIVGRGFIRKFALEEPSLNDIFIEKVGASYE